MSRPPFDLDPMKIYATMATAMYEASVASQDRWIRAFEAMAHPDTSPLKVRMVEVPVVSFVPTMNDQRLRELFQTMADQNLRRWEHTANLLAASPAWMRSNHKTPGSVMTEMFDRARRRTDAAIHAANDSGAPARPRAADTRPPAAPAPRQEGPARLSKPDGTPDDLTSIKGIGPKLSSLLNDLGIYHFAQIAEWTGADSEWIDDKLAFKGRVAREKWVQQARKLVKASAA